MPTKPRTYSPEWKAPTSLGVWGGSRATRARLALAIAQRIDPGFYWLQAVGDVEPREVPEASLAGRVGAGHLFYLRPTQLSPQTRSGPVADWFVRDDVAPDARVQRIGELLRLPSLARTLLQGRTASSPTRALVIADANLAEPFLSLEEGGVRPFFEAFHQLATSLVVTISNRPRPNARDFDYLFYIRPGSEDVGSLAEVECQQGPPAGTPGLFHPGSVGRLNALVEELRRSPAAQRGD